MAAIFSIPTYPGATSYAIQFSDPGSDANAPNPFGSWSNVTGSPFTNPSNIIDPTGNQNLRMYRAAPTVLINGTSVVYPYYRPFSVAMSDPGIYLANATLYDPQITSMLQAFRDFVGDNPVQQTASTLISLDTGAGTGLLQPDGVTKIFNLADMPDAVPDVVLEGSVSVSINGVTKLENTDYWVNYECGQVIFATAPAANAAISIIFGEVRYTNRILNAALANGVDRLATLGINGYGITYDNNVKLMLLGITTVGLRFIIFLTAQKILNQAVIWAKAQAARAYKIDGFSMDTAPSRILDGMSNQTQADFSELKDAVDKYIRTATKPIVYSDMDSFFDTNGLLPSWSAVWQATRFGAWI